MNKVELHKKIISDMHEVYLAKNNDYGNSVHDTYKKYGMTSFLVRMEDKLNRLYSLSMKKAMVQDEKIEDTLLDLANYSILAIMELQGYDLEEKCESEVDEQWDRKIKRKTRQNIR